MNEMNEVTAAAQNAVATAAADVDMVARLALALAVGLLIGVQRGWHTRNSETGARTAGLRTFTLIGLGGGLFGLLSFYAGDWILFAGVLAISALVIAGYIALLQTTKDYGQTTEVAAIVTFVLGIFAVRGDMIITAASAVVVMAVLDLKTVGHKWVGQLEHAEVNGAIKLLLISVVLLPLIPNEGFGPGGVLNPFAMWWMVVAIAGLAFVAYAAIRIAGARAGTLLTGFFGGLASSTAVTVTCARMAKKTPALSYMLGAAISMATAVMFVRTLILVSVFNPSAAGQLALPLLAAAVGSLASIVILNRMPVRKSGASGEDTQIVLGPPTDINMAIKFGIVLVLVTLAVHYAKEWFGGAGVVGASAIAGTVDVDAAVLSVARTAFGDGAVVTLSVLVAVLVNTLVKAVYAFAIAGPAFAKVLALAIAIPIAAGAAGYAVSFLFI